MGEISDEEGSKLILCGSCLTFFPAIFVGVIFGMLNHYGDVAELCN